jgi:hypothetical protein
VAGIGRGALSEKEGQSPKKERGHVRGRVPKKKDPEQVSQILRNPLMEMFLRLCLSTGSSSEFQFLSSFRKASV